MTIDNFCICYISGCLGDMVQCDECFLWFHKDCNNVPADVCEHKFLYLLCLNSTPHIVKRCVVFVSARLKVVLR